MLNGEGRIHLEISKDSKERVEALVIMLRSLQGEDVIMKVEKYKEGRRL